MRLQNNRKHVTTLVILARLRVKIFLRPICPLPIKNAMPLSVPIGLPAVTKTVLCIAQYVPVVPVRHDLVALLLLPFP